MDARLFDWGCAYKSKKASNISNSKVRMLLLLPHGVKNVAKKRGVNNNNNNTNNVDGEWAWSFGYNILVYMLPAASREFPLTLP